MNWTVPPGPRQRHQRQSWSRMAAAPAAAGTVSESNASASRRQRIGPPGVGKQLMESRRLVQSCFEKFRAQEVANGATVSAQENLFARLVASIGAWIGTTQQIHWKFTARLVRFQRELLCSRQVAQSQSACCCRCHYACSPYSDYYLNPCESFVPRQSPKIRFADDDHRDNTRATTSQRRGRRPRRFSRLPRGPVELASLDNRCSAPVAAVQAATPQWPFNYSSLSVAPLVRNQPRRRRRRPLWIWDENESSSRPPSAFWDEALLIWSWQRHQQFSSTSPTSSTIAAQAPFDAQDTRPLPNILFGSTGGTVPLLCQLESSLMENWLTDYPLKRQPPRDDIQGTGEVENALPLDANQQRTYTPYVPGSFPGEVQIHNNALERFPFGMYLKIAVVLFFLNFSTGWVFLLGFVGFVHLSGGLDPILHLFQDLHYRFNRGTPPANPASRPTLSQTLTELRARRTMQLRAARAIGEAQRALEFLQRQSMARRPVNTSANVPTNVSGQVSTSGNHTASGAPQVVGSVGYTTSGVEVKPSGDASTIRQPMDVSGEGVHEPQATDITRATVADTSTNQLRSEKKQEVSAGTPSVGASASDARILDRSLDSLPSSSSSLSSTPALIFTTSHPSVRVSQHGSSSSVTAPQVSRVVLALQRPDMLQRQQPLPRQALWIRLGTRFLRWVYQLFVVFVFSINPHWRPVTSLIWDSTGNSDIDASSGATAATLAGATSQILLIASAATAAAANHTATATQRPPSSSSSSSSSNDPAPHEQATSTTELAVSNAPNELGTVDSTANLDTGTTATSPDTGE